MPDLNSILRQGQDIIGVFLVDFLLVFRRVFAVLFFRPLARDGFFLVDVFFAFLAICVVF